MDERNVRIKAVRMVSYKIKYIFYKKILKVTYVFVQNIIFLLPRS